MKKEVIIVAGANGSGKTTFAKKLLEVLNYEFLNADEIAKRINPKDLTKARLKAGKKFLRKVNSLIKNGESFILETTLAGKYIEKIIKSLNNENYIVSIFFIFLDSPEECINRIKQRIKKGEHNIPNKDVIRRYYRGKINFWGKYKYMANRWYVIDNSFNSFNEVCAGSIENIIPSDKILLKEFLKDLNE